MIPEITDVTANGVPLRADLARDDCGINQIDRQIRLNNREDVDQLTGDIESTFGPAIAGEFETQIQKEIKKSTEQPSLPGGSLDSHFDDLVGTPIAIKGVARTADMYT